ncbi:hypothetical protein SAMN02745181_2964 [Rubritalea squalenifaciens DSM 18772]|uniref:Uncharacterized protein n=2 Tax=Rubritalea TaxID=361050 RepID=A0A1M6NTZ2_9BACT|nr:hypothetical protein SAMN02745181_2964 [Rubritalea squalenifaciens DSM 18772]
MVVLQTKTTTPSSQPVSTVKNLTIQLQMRLIHSANTIHSLSTFTAQYL